MTSSDIDGYELVEGLSDFDTDLEDENIYDTYYDGIDYDSVYSGNNDHYFELDPANLDSDAVIVSDEELVDGNDENEFFDGNDENEFFDGYDENNTLNISTDSDGDQTDLELPDSNYYSAYIDEYLNSLENINDDASEIGKQYVKTA